jgi:hypothetical protein
MLCTVREIEITFFVVNSLQYSTSAGNAHSELFLAVPSANGVNRLAG